MNRPTSRVTALSAGAVALSLLLPLSAHAAETGDAARGQALFRQTCALCHSSADITGGAMGPSLAGVVGRPAGSLADFGSYSTALKGSGLRWDAATLDRYLAAPSELVPGTIMPQATPDAGARRDLLAYLDTQKKAATASQSKAAEGRDPSGDWREDAPGKTHRVDLAKLPAAYATPSSDNKSQRADRPEGALPKVPEGFTVSVYASKLNGPRNIRAAPNGDLLVTETGANRVHVLRGVESATQDTIFAKGLKIPVGLALYPAGPNPKWVYVANTDSVVRFPYTVGDTVASGPAEVIVPKLPSGGHGTRNLVFSADGKKLFISVGSASNVDEGSERKSPAEARAWDAEHGIGAGWGPEELRAAVLVTDPEGKTPLKVYASGIRNCVNMALQPVSGALWCAVNERDGLGDDQVPDYATAVKEGGFYGWPWYYVGNHEDPRHAGARPDLAGKALTPDVLFQAHSAAVGIAFYGAAKGAALFPKAYQGDAFVALHGSWNRSLRTGYKLVRLPMKNGRATGAYEDFMTGFVLDDDRVWGRPVSVSVAPDGALLVGDDAAKVIWRIAPKSAR